MRVKEHPQVAPGERAEGGLDLRFERGHLLAFIAAPRVADKQVVGHVAASGCTASWSIDAGCRVR